MNEDIDNYGEAIGDIESGGNYGLVGTPTRHGRALGKYQVMEEFLPEWTKEIFGKSLTPQQFLSNPKLQDALFKQKFSSYLEQHGNPQDAASMWLTGQPLATAGNAKDVYGTDAKTYVGKFNKSLKNIQMKKQQVAQNDDEDLLSSFVKGSSPDNTAQQASSDDEDLLGSFIKQKTAAPESEKQTAGTDTASISDTAPISISHPMARYNPDAPGSMASIIKNNSGEGFVPGIKRFAAGVGQGISDVGNTVGQFGNYALGRNGSSLNDVIKKENANFNDAAGEGLAAGTGRITGQIAGTLPALVVGAAALPEAATGFAASSPWLSSLAGGALSGAAANALTSSTSEEPLTQQIAEGAGTGAILGPLGKGASKLGGSIFGNAVGSETAQLAKVARDKYGIPITSGQMSSNPTARFFDSVLQRLPFTGYGARTAEQQSGLNRAIANEMGVDSDIVSPKVVKQARKAAGKDMEDFVTSVGNLPGDQPLANHLSQIYKDAKVNVPDKLAAVENRLQEIVDAFGNNKKLDAKTYAGLIRKNGPLDPKMADGKVGYYVMQMRNALDDLVERNAPADKVQNFKNARYRYAIAKAIEPLAKKAGPEGDISPALLLNKAKGGNLEELGNIGQRFLKEPPSSGTAERGSLLALGAKAAGGLTGLGATAGGAYYFDPEHFQRDALLLATLGAGGRGASKFLRSDFLANRAISGGLRKGIGQVSKKANPLSGLISPTAGALMLSRSAPPAR